MTIDTDRFRTLLLEARGQVEEAIDRLHRENEGSLADTSGELVPGSADQHLGDAATATFDRELDYTLEDNEEALLEQIDGALERIEAGTYGICRRCGRQIPEERLEARPWAEYDIECQREVEAGRA